MKMNKRTKKVVTMVLTLSLVLVSCISAFAAESKGQEVTYQFNEFATLNALKTQDDNTLRQSELTSDNISQSELTSNDINQMEKQMRNELSRRTELSDTVLSQMGYSSSDIATLRTLTGNESLTELAQTKALLASVTCSRSLDLYKYRKSEDKTYFSVNISYSWDKIPMILWKDIVGIGWNNDYKILSQSGYNVLKTNYVNTLTGKTSSKKYSFVENNLCASSVNIPMNIAVANQTDYSVWPKSGSATIQLCAAGKKTNSKFALKYGHKTISAGAPSIAAPWGVGFTFSSVEAEYSPSSGVLNASTPTTI